MATRKKKTAVELSPQPNPRADLDGQELLSRAAPVLDRLGKDLLARADGYAGVTAALRARHAMEVEKKRTAMQYDEWRRAFVDQVAAAWFLSVVFVRTLEDRGLLRRSRIAGPGALDAQRAFFALAPHLTERDYLLTVFRELTHLPAAAELFDARHNPVWLLAPSAEATQELLELFRAPNADTPAFRFGGDSRFLGDLYQDLNADVRARYALLQTPRFVESFILDRTLTPALERFGDSWEPSLARIVGVLHSWDERSQSLVGTRIEVVRDFLLQALRSRHAYSAWEGRGRPEGDDWSDWFAAVQAIPSL